MMHPLFNRLNMAKRVYKTGQQCRSCAQDPARRDINGNFSTFAPAGPVEFVAMDNLRTLPRLNEGAQFIIIPTNRYTTLTRAVLTAKSKATQIETKFIGQWVMQYGVPWYSLANFVPQFVGKFFTTT